MKTTEDLSPEERGSAPGCPLRSGVTNTAGFSVELMVSNIQQTVHKLSGAQQRSAETARRGCTGHSALSSPQLRGRAGVGEEAFQRVPQPMQ